MTIYPELADVQQVIERFAFHIRDAGLLSSALARPSSSMFGIDAYPSIDRKAAALLDSLVKNHALADGNKRMAWTTTIVFLWLNGFSHTFTTDEAFDLVLGVAEGSIDLDESERRIAARRVPR